MKKDVIEKTILCVTCKRELSRRTLIGSKSTILSWRWVGMVATQVVARFLLYFVLFLSPYLPTSTPRSYGQVLCTARAPA